MVGRSGGYSGTGGPEEREVMYVPLWYGGEGDKLMETEWEQKWHIADDSRG